MDIPFDDVAAARRTEATPWPSSRVISLLATLGPLVIWMVAFGVAGLLASPDVADGQCEGIGFGCTLAPRDTALFVGLYLGVPVVAVTTLVTALALLAPPRARPIIVCSLVALFAAGTALVAGFLLVGSSV